jgi:UDPglucose 6-dehydrogenase
MLTTAVIGKGWVGKSMIQLFPDSVIYDEPQILERVLDDDQPDVLDEERGKVNNCNVAFVCVPTPNKGWSPNDCSIVEDVLDWCDCDLIIVRSTVNPGFTDEWVEKTGKQIVFQPEYLGETPRHPFIDPTLRPFMILGGEREAREMAIEVYTQTYNANTSIRQTTAYEAEVIKLSENRAIMYKVMQCQELYDACKAHKVDYYTVRDAVYGDDPRFNLWWTFVYPEARGANSKCIPKDVYAWSAWAETCPLTDAMLEYNEELLGVKRSNTQ